MEFVADKIGRRVCPKGTVGVFHLVIKSGSDNFRESSILDIMKRFRGDGYRVVVYEPTVRGEHMEFPVEEDPGRSRDGCDVILANRMAEELEPVVEKVYCRDIFNKD